MMIPKEKAVPEREVVESVARETRAGKGSASDASCSGHERAAAGDHTSLEATARESAEMRSADGKASSSGRERAAAGHHPPMEATTREPADTHSTATETAAAKMHSSTAKPAVHSPTAEPAVHATETAERHRWAWKGNCRSEQGGGEAPKDTAIHDPDLRTSVAAIPSA
jgi:hypothetical protein